VIPQRSDQDGGRGGCRAFDRIAYRGRNAIERCVGRLKECRRVATRYDKLVSSFLAILKMAVIERYLRILFRNGA
jgi:transposase